MKKWTGILAVILMMSCQQDKIAYVDNVKLMEGYQKRKDVEAAYQLKSEDFNKRRDSISQTFQLEAQEVQNQTKNMSQEKAQEEYDLLQQKGQIIAQQLQREEQQMQRTGQMKMDSVVSEARKLIKEYGATNGYGFILTGGEGGSVLYGKEAADITDDVLKLLNEEYNK
ncbi:MAG: OmpH family outer membrane protein [Robiginitalea sp.]|jgi:outer membrane protein